jgi:hypothetical protein
MNFRSSYDKVAPELGHQSSELEKTSTALESLTRSVLPTARQVLAEAMARQTSAAATAILRVQALEILRSVVNDRTIEEMEGSAGKDEREARSWFGALEDNLAGAAAAAVGTGDQEWLEVLSRDLARAFAVFHLNWSTRTDRSALTVDERAVGAWRAEVEALGRRFGLLDSDVQTLLVAVRQLQSLALPQAQHSQPFHGQYAGGG